MTMQKIYMYMLLLLSVILWCSGGKSAEDAAINREFTRTTLLMCTKSQTLCTGDSDKEDNFKAYLLADLKSLLKFVRAQKKTKLSVKSAKLIKGTIRNLKRSSKEEACESFRKPCAGSGFEWQQQ